MSVLSFKIDILGLKAELRSEWLLHVILLLIYLQVCDCLDVAWVPSTVGHDKMFKIYRTEKCNN